MSAWHLTDIPTAPAFVRYWMRTNAASDRGYSATHEEAMVAFKAV